MKKVFSLFLIGLSVCLILYLFLLPFYIIFSKLTPKQILIYIPLGTFFLVFLGWMASSFKSSLIHHLAKFTIKALSNLYKEILLQSVKHFYPEKENIAFKEVVEFEFRDGIFILAFIINKKETTSTIYIPTSPNPTAGFILNVSNSMLKTVKLTTEEMIEYTISHGVSG